MKKRVCSLLFVALIMLSCLVQPTYALSANDIYQITDLTGYLFNKGYDFGALLGSLFDQSVCPMNPNTDKRHNFVERHTTIGGKNGYFYVCEYCGTSAGEVVEPAYDEYVSTLPTSGIGSDGALYFTPSHTSLTFYSTTEDWKYYCEHSPSPLSPADIGTLTCLPSFFSFSSKVSSGCINPAFGYDVTCVYPVDGTYSLFSGFNVKCVYRTLDGTIQNSDITESISFGSGSLYKLQGAEDVFWFRCWPARDGRFVRVEASFSLPVIRCVPETGLLNPANDTTYNVNTRPTSITGGNYGIVGDDGTINTVTNTTNNNQIVNETNNTYYNPATGQTSTIKDWTYNYQDRSYTITLENGDTATVTYGDENISISENNVVEGSTTTNNYTIYYMIENPSTPQPSPSPSAPACTHSWEETSRNDPDCISSGSVTFTCSQCGQTKTETLKAKGHDWKVEHSVQTTYDEQGNLLQQGYTIYKCSVCGEQYKDDHSTGPPGGTPADDDSIWNKIGEFLESIFSGIGELLKALLEKILDFLNDLGEMLMSKLRPVIEVVTSLFDELPQLFNRFLDFLGVVFPYLPPELTMLLTFGVVALVFIGIIKAVRR